MPEERNDRMIRLALPLPQMALVFSAVLEVYATIDPAEMEDGELFAREVWQTVRTLTEAMDVSMETFHAMVAKHYGGPTPVMAALVVSFQEEL